MLESYPLLKICILLLFMALSSGWVFISILFVYFHQVLAIEWFKWQESFYAASQHINDTF